MPEENSNKGRWNAICGPSVARRDNVLGNPAQQTGTFAESRLATPYPARRIGDVPCLARTDSEMGILPFRAVISFSRPWLGALPCQWWWRKEVTLPEARRRRTFLGRREHGVTVDLVWQAIGQERYMMLVAMHLCSSMKLLPAVDENCSQLLGDMRIAAQLTILGGIPVWWCNAWHTCCGVRGSRWGAVPVTLLQCRSPTPCALAGLFVVFVSTACR